jgi:hypothetical protein
LYYFEETSGPKLVRVDRKVNDFQPISGIRKLTLRQFTFLHQNEINVSQTIRPSFGMARTLLLRQHFAS